MRTGVREPRQIIGIDIGGTKCAVGHLRDGRVIESLRIPTEDYDVTLEALIAGVAAVRDDRPADVGISCGGPLDAGAGIIGTPPNLPSSWHGAAICAALTDASRGRVCLMNDANACALAEWKFGSGRGTRHMIFLTSGTGMGGGLILNGQLYEGTTGDAGEIGHVRLAPDGPVGYGKRGSVEGFCSGGGIARFAEELMARRGGARPPWAAPGRPISTKAIAGAARAGDALAVEIMSLAGGRLGEALAILLDLFNPERVVIGGFFPACRDLLTPAMEAALERESLTGPRRACQIVPGKLGDTIGSHGAVAAAMHAFHEP